MTGRGSHIIKIFSESVLWVLKNILFFDPDPHPIREGSVPRRLPHDTYTGAVNIRKVLEVLERKGLWKHDDIEVKRVFLQSDGASKEYKSANASAHLKQAAKTFNLVIMLDFYG